MFFIRSLTAMPRLSREERSRAIGQLQAGVPVRRVALLFNVSRTTVYYWQQRFQANTGVADLQRSGRPRVTTPGEDRHIQTAHLRDRFRTASTTARTFPGQNPISRHTVRRRLNEHGIFARRPLQRTLLRPHHRLARLQWAQAHLVWTR